MRHVWFAAALYIGLNATPAIAAPGPVTNDCDQLEFRMQMSNEAGHRASCVVSATTSSGQRITKTFTGYVKSLPVLGNPGRATEAMILDESCATCKEPQHHKFGLSDFAKVSAFALSSVTGEAEGVDADAAVRAELSEGVESCHNDQLGEPLNLTPVQLLKCRIDMLNTKAPEADVAYYRRWLQPDLQRLVRSFDPNQRLLGRQALQVIDQAHQAEPRIHESLRDMAIFSTYREAVDTASQAIEAAGASPQAHAYEIARLGMLQRQWTRSYQLRRDALEQRGALDADLQQSSKLMEATLNVMYGKYGAEIKQVQQQTEGASGQGRTQFGQPQSAPRATTTPTSTPAAKAGAQTINSRILRPQ